MKLLFLIGVNDLPAFIAPIVDCIMYGDDTTFVITADNADNLDVNVNETLHTAKSWFNSNVLHVNKGKTQNMIFKMGNIEVASAKLLGITMDSKLNWNKHIDVLAGKLSKVLYLLRRTKPLLDQNIILKIYYALFHCHLLYGIRLWGNCTRKNEIFILQKKAIRIISGSDVREHCKPLFVNLKIMTLPSIYIYACLLFIKQNESAFPIRKYYHEYSTRFCKNIHMPLTRLDVTKKSFLRNSIKFYNLLTENMELLNINKFNLVLKHHFINHPYYDIKEFNGI